MGDPLTFFPRDASTIRVLVRRPYAGNGRSCGNFVRGNVTMMPSRVSLETSPQTQRGTNDVCIERAVT